jgi:hypothetical protein
VTDRVLSGEERFLGPAGTPGNEGLGVVIATPVPDPDGSTAVIGALVGLYDWHQLTAVTRSVRDDLTSLGLVTDVLVVHRDGTVIGGSRSSTAQDALRSADWSDIAASAARDRPDYVVESSAGFLVGRATLGSDFPDWRLLIVEPLGWPPLRPGAWYDPSPS